jgi:hypothetical protein
MESPNNKLYRYIWWEQKIGATPQWKFLNFTVVMGGGTHEAREASISGKRAALYGILAGLTVHHWVGQRMDIKDGAVTVQSYTSAALRVTLRQGPVGVSMEMQDNYDIVLEIRQLLKEIACKVIPEWTHTERSKKTTSNNRASGYRQNTRCIAPPPRLTTTVAMDSTMEDLSHKAYHYWWNKTCTSNL